jgi:hypothetical protein
MKNRMRILILALVLVLAVGGGATVYSLVDQYTDKITQAGEIVADIQSNGDQTVVATYKGNAIRQSEVDFLRAAFALQEPPPQELSWAYTDKSQYTDRDYIHEIVTDKILKEEAARLGLAATDAEIQAEVSQIQQLYAEEESIRGEVDTYCAGAGITIDEYWETIPILLGKTITLGKLRQSFEEQYIEDHPDEQLSQEILHTAYENYKQQLFNASARYITYAEEIVTPPTPITKPTPPRTNDG